MKGNTMRNLQKRTVFYVQQNQDGNWVDLYCLDSQEDARNWAEKNKILDAQILEVETATRNPELVNQMFVHDESFVDPMTDEQFVENYFENIRKEKNDDEK